MPDDPSPTDGRSRLRAAAALGVLLVAAVAAAVVLPLGGDPGPAVRSARLSDLHTMVADGLVEEAAIDEGAQRVSVWPTDEGREAGLEAAERFAADADGDLAPVAPDDTLVLSAGYPAAYADTLTETLLDQGVPLGASPAQRSSLVLTLLINAAPLILVLAAGVWLLRRQGMLGRFGAGKTTAVEVPGTRFDDVAGIDEAVEELRELVAFLHRPEDYGLAGARAPRGVLLEGPPGTGKTLLARAVAGEAGVPFYAISGSDFVEMFAGVGAKRVRDLFEKAREAEAAVVFIDEIDAIGRKRSGGQSHGGNEEREQTLNQLLVEMGGFADDASVIVMAATNRADLLDEALTRPGRFDRRVAVPAPDRGGRTEILRVHTRDKQLADDVDLVALARRTPGMTGAELENLVNTAALGAARDRRTTVTADDLDAALQTVAMGKARTSALVTERDRTITAWHEAGHAIAALVQPGADDPVTVSIIPRGPAGGVTWMAGNDRQFTTRSEAKAQLAVALAGRAAEELLLDGDFTQGAHGDLQSATDLALKMVTSYGMAGGLSVYSPERYQAGGSSADVDAAVEELLAEALDSARRLVGHHREALEELVDRLLEHETVTEDHLEDLRGETPVEPVTEVAVA